MIVQKKREGWKERKKEKLEKKRKSWKTKEKLEKEKIENFDKDFKQIICSLLLSQEKLLLRFICID